MPYKYMYIVGVQGKPTKSTLVEKWDFLANKSMSVT
jgi:hypothetical protein